ncbi:methyl-accepting chemotaxis protein [Desemzia sp. FAM 24101]|uniref:methyl-accepting chemotaxis protein n=1 Tax=unclassified Desemzia TaxID=2685243 RepID=UPI00388493EB
MKLKQKLLTGFFTITTLLILISGITYVQLKDVNDKYTSAIAEGTNKIRLTSYTLFETYQEEIELQTYLTAGNSENLDAFSVNQKEFQENVANLTSHTNYEEGLELTNQIISAEAEYGEIAEEAISYKQAGNTEAYTALMNGRGNEIFNRIQSIGKELLFYHQDAFTKVSDDLTNQIKKMLTVIMIISILAVAAGVIIALRLSRMISSRVNQVAEVAEKIADGDLAIEEITITSKDEISQLGHTFNRMIINLRNMIQQVSNTSEQVASSSQEFLAIAEETTAVTNQIATSITDVADGVETQSKSTEESSHGVSEIATGILQITSNTNVVAQTTIETKKQADQGTQKIQSVVQQMTTIYQANKETNQVMESLEKRSMVIGNIINVITDISNQTNLLALNAAIESARAGEHGKGFAVVADEVRKLAEQSRESANQIAELIQHIQADTTKAVEMMQHGNDEITQGMSIAEETGKAFELIVHSIEDTNVQTQELSATSEQISASVQQVNAAIEEVAELAKDSSAKSGEIAAATEEQLAAAEEVTSSATFLAQLAEELTGLVSAFKL